MHRFRMTKRKDNAEAAAAPMEKKKDAQQPDDNPGRPSTAEPGTGSIEVYNIKIQQSFDQSLSLPPISVWSRVVDKNSFLTAVLLVTIKRRGLIFDRQLASGFYTCILSRQGHLVIYTRNLEHVGYAVKLSKASRLLIKCTNEKSLGQEMSERKCKVTAQWRFGSVILNLQEQRKMADWCRTIVDATSPTTQQRCIEATPPARNQQKTIHRHSSKTTIPQAMKKMKKEEAQVQTDDDKAPEHSADHETAMPSEEDKERAEQSPSPSAASSQSAVVVSASDSSAHQTDGKTPAAAEEEGSEDAEWTEAEDTAADFDDGHHWKTEEDEPSEEEEAAPPVKKDNNEDEKAEVAAIAPASPQRRVTFSNLKTVFAKAAEEEEEDEQPRTTSGCSILAPVMICTDYDNDEEAGEDEQDNKTRERGWAAWIPLPAVSKAPAQDNGDDERHGNTETGTPPAAAPTADSPKMRPFRVGSSGTEEHSKDGDDDEEQ